jgi:hypothetical protein
VCIKTHVNVLHFTYFLKLVRWSAGLIAWVLTNWTHTIWLTDYGALVQMKSFCYFWLHSFCLHASRTVLSCDSLLDALSLCGSEALLLDLAHFFSFLIFYTAGRTPWMGDQPVTRLLPTHAQTQNKCTQTSMPQVDLKPQSQCLSGRSQFMP